MPQRPRLSLIGTIALLIIVAAVGLLQQGGNGVWQNDGSKGRDTAANSAGQFDYYSLVMSWSPTHCSTPEGEDDTQQCSRRDGRRYAFVLHGLWPQYERGYPESCRTRDRPFVPQPVIDDMLDVMPSKGLIIHQYRKHGTCSGLDPDDYFNLARRLFQSIRIPDRFVNPFEPQSLSPEQLIADLVNSNPQLKPDMVAVACGGPGNRLKEVRICFTREGKLRSCGANEVERRLCRGDRFSVPPVRSTKRPY
jgi:ribonuclease T2